ncbi:MAG TPA: hypothetical protein VGF16_16750 [Bryobacteraceae bacterium]|jgi:hypothetical protein
MNPSVNPPRGKRYYEKGIQAAKLAFSIAADIYPRKPGTNIISQLGVDAALFDEAHAMLERFLEDKRRPRRSAAAPNGAAESRDAS